jgi:hypothetical protein
MIEVNDKITKYKNWAVGGFVVLGYLFFFGSTFILQISPYDKSFFRVNWLTRIGVIFLVIALVLSASIGKKRPTSIWFWIVITTCLIGMFFLGPQLLGIFAAIFWLLYFMYKSFESFNGYLAKAVKSYRQLQSEIEKQ